jgi:hypothetical protein
MPVRTEVNLPVLLSSGDAGGALSKVVEKPGFSRLIKNVRMQGGRHPEE